MENIEEKPSTKAEEVDFIRSNIVFEGLKEDDIEKLAHAATGVYYKKGQTILLEGEPSSNFYIIMKGKVLILKTSPSGNQLLIKIRAQGAGFGYLSVMGSRPYFATAKAAEDSILIRIRRQDVIEFFPKNPNALQITLDEAHVLLDLYSRLVDFVVKTAGQRVVETLLILSSEYGTEIGFDHQEIAGMSGTTIETVSRIFSSLKSVGVIQPGRGKIKILDVVKLRSVIKFPSDLNV